MRRQGLMFAAAVLVVAAFAPAAHAVTVTADASGGAFTAMIQTSLLPTPYGSVAIRDGFCFGGRACVEVDRARVIRINAPHEETSTLTVVHELGHVADLVLGQRSCGLRRRFTCMAPWRREFLTVLRRPVSRRWRVQSAELFADVYATCAVEGPAYMDVVPDRSTATYGFRLDAAAYRAACGWMDAMMRRSGFDAPVAVSG